MTRNILLTALDASDSDRNPSYYSAQNEFGFDYCEALQSMEASTKYVLSRFPIDAIFVIGEEMPSDREEILKPQRLRDAKALYSANLWSLSSFDLYRYRLAQYIDEISLEQQAINKLLSEEDRAKLIQMITSFIEKNSKQESKRLNRFFDELASNRSLLEQLQNELFAAFQEHSTDLLFIMTWATNYLYMQLKSSSKLEILPVNENLSTHYIPVDMLENREYWVNSILDTDPEQPVDNDEINLFVSLGNNSVIDDHLVLNILDILISTPGSNVHLKKIYKVFETSRTLTGKILDRTFISQSTELVAAAHAFLNYNKTDMLVSFWENSGEHNERISSLVYAARHVDIGISMCNLQEVQEGIDQLRELLRDERSWAETGKYGSLFGVIAGCILSDYSTLLEGDGPISFMALIKWAYRHQLYQQVLTLIETYAPENLVKAGIFYYCDDESKVDAVTNLFALQRLELKPYEYYKMDPIEHYFVKTYDRGSVKFDGSKGEDRNLAYALLRAQSVNNSDPSKITGYTACDSMETLQNVLYAYFHLGEVRNKISHADADAMTERRLVVSKNDVSYAMHLMTESIEYFITTYETALNEVRSKKPNNIAISSGSVRKAAERLRREGSQDDRSRFSKKQ